MKLSKQLVAIASLAILGCGMAYAANSSAITEYQIGIGNNTGAALPVYSLVSSFVKAEQATPTTTPTGSTLYSFKALLPSQGTIYLTYGTAKDNVGIDILQSTGSCTIEGNTYYTGFCTAGPINNGLYRISVEILKR